MDANDAKELADGGRNRAAAKTEVSGVSDAMSASVSSDSSKPLTSTAAFESKKMNQLEQDVIAKQKGRTAATGPAKPGAFSATNNTDVITTSGASVSQVTKDVGQLEQDIVAKQKGRSSTVAPSKPGAFAESSNSAVGLEASIRAKQTASASQVTKDVGQLEQDIVAKQKGRSTVAPSKPGAFAESNNSAVGLEASIRAKQTASVSQVTKDVGQLEQDVVAKQKGRSSAAVPSKPGAFAESSNSAVGLEASIRAKQTASVSQVTKDVGQLEQDIVAKQKGRSSTAEPSKPGAFAESSNSAVGLEASIRAKQTASVSQVTKDVGQLEQDIVAKQKGRSITAEPSKPGAFAENSNSAVGLEASIRAKQTASASHVTKDVGQLEQDIVAKQKGRSSTAEPSKPGAFAESSNSAVGLEASIRAKQTGSVSHVTKDVDQLEQDIVAKQKGRSTTAEQSKPGAFVESSNSAVGLEASIRAKQTGSVSQATKDIGQLEEDIVAKQKGRPITDQPSKPGAFVESSNSAVGLEASIRAKQTGSVSQVTKDIGQLEEDIVAKQKGRPISEQPSKPGVFVESNNSAIGLEASIRAKQTGSVSQVTKDIGQLEEDIVAKQKGRPISNEPSKPGVFDESNNSNILGLEASIRAKQTGSVSQVTKDIGQLERDIAAKQRGFSSSTEPTETAEILGFEADVLTKQTGSVSRGVTERDLVTRDLAQMEGDILAKQQGRSTKPVVDDLSADIDEFENDLESKLVANKNGDGKIGAESGEEKGEIQHGKDDKQFSTGMQQGIYSNLNGMDDLEYGEYGADDENGLAVACAIEEEDGDMYLPAAVEYDPDAKPPMYRNRRFRMYLCLAIVAVIVGVVGAVLGITMTNEDVPQEIPYRATLGIRENIARIVSSEQLDDYTSAYRKALDWIMYYDPTAITPDNPKLFQRYLLVYLYYATSVKRPWIFGCAPSVDSTDLSCGAEFIDSIEPLRNGTQQSIRWLSSADECEWAGIDCDNSGQVRSIDLSGMGMTGTFPESILNLPFLQAVSLQFGELEGLLPDIPRKGFLALKLEGNAFTGTIPDSWFEARMLFGLQLASNQISGTISDNISNWKDLHHLFMTDNLLEGTIPTQIGNMVNMALLRFNINRLNGTIPTEAGHLRHALSFEFSYNELTGTIPTEMGMLGAVDSLFLNENSLTGKIPDELWQLKDMQYFYLANNHLSGTISGQMSKWSRLSEVKIQDNQFTGNLPARLGLTNVYLMQASGNNFNGTVPGQLCDLVNSGQLENLELDCAIPSGGGTPEIECPCCTLCCAPNGQQCYAP